MQEQTTEVTTDSAKPDDLPEINGKTPVLPKKFKFYGVPGSACLQEVCQPVEEYNTHLQEVADTLLVTAEFYHAVGLAAPQIGVMERVFVARINGAFTVFVNPSIVDMSGTTKQREGCISFPEATAFTTRAEDVVVQAFDTKGEMFTLALDGIESVTVQHEYDHLDGILFLEKMTPLWRRKVTKKTKKILTKYGML